MPNCVNTLPRLEVLDMDYCEMLMSVENPPHTLRELSVYSYRSFQPVAYKSSLMKIKFDPEMSPLKLLGVDRFLSPFEIDGMVKIQSMASVEEKVLCSLGWTNLDSIKEKHKRVYKDAVGESIECQTQMYYELGIFSTIYEGKEMPDFISHRSKGSSISFIIPSCPKNLRGLNFCCVEMYPFEINELPMIRISNITKNLTWIYKHYIDYVQLGGHSKYNTFKSYIHKVKLGWKNCLSLLSHWMFGPNEMKAGDHVTITIGQKYTIECGIGLVYEDDDGKIEEEEEDVLGYYKSWNHIIGRDLFAFQLTTGEYILDSKQFTRFSPQTYADYHPFIGIEGSFKEEVVAFKAFSQKTCLLKRLNEKASRH
ncbi:hypothetical protein M8C21_020028 [Ambrosia artemisiifolia]|uniref:Uncharacterized protein n=1 Tax=Ambrosia artemisiifolia TaxID=4212 RepID=A0AAD5D368_AMBAR|nr:hypothetical protein M8C21_020028 [Ambrosia artemisiifolia]